MDKWVVFGISFVTCCLVLVTAAIYFDVGKGDGRA